jgi:phosphoglycolate phosphatase-like HAD superfamily hydrolase
VTDNGAAADLLTDREHVLLAFTGAICEITDLDVTDRLRAYLQPELPVALAITRNPFDVLRYARQQSGTTAVLVERELRSRELAAVTTATATPGALETVRALAIAGHTITIVSNISADAVRAYLARHELGQYVFEVSARNTEDPTPLKPDPFLLRQAMRVLGTTPGRCCMVGSSVDDIRAAQAADVPVIAYLGASGDRAGLLSCGPDAAIENLVDLVSACSG